MQHPRSSTRSSPVSHPSRTDVSFLILLLHHIHFSVEIPSTSSSGDTPVTIEGSVEAIAAQVYALLAKKLPIPVTPPQTTSTPTSQRSRVSRKIQHLKYEIDTDKERASNLVCLPSPTAHHLSIRITGTRPSTIRGSFSSRKR